jgi:hypothetical protein
MNITLTLDDNNQLYAQCDLTQLTRVIHIYFWIYMLYKIFDYVIVNKSYEYYNELTIKLEKIEEIINKSNLNSKSITDTNMNIENV